MVSLAAECKFLMPKLSQEEIRVNQIRRAAERNKMAAQNELLLNTTYGIGQLFMTILGLKDIQRSALPFPKS